jgi:hypothetical protein
LGKQQGGYYLLGSRTIPGLILVKAMPGLTSAELDENLRSGYTDPTVQLTPKGPITELTFQGGSGKLAEVRGSLTGSEVEGLLAGYLRPGGGGLLLFAVTSPDQWPKLNPVAQQVAQSVSLFVPDPQELIRLWAERLAGFKLIHKDGGTDRREPPNDQAVTQTYTLCSDGTFFYERGAEAPSAENQAADSAGDQRAGKWKLVPTRLRTHLVFSFPDGKNRSYRLSRYDQETYLDDQRYFVLPNDRCR